MNDLKISFEHSFLKCCGEISTKLLNWDETYEMYTNPDTQLAFIWYCRGYCQGERG